jgi:hypothetical protein
MSRRRRQTNGHDKAVHCCVLTTALNFTPRDLPAGTDSVEFVRQSLSEVKQYVLWNNMTESEKLHTLSSRRHQRQPERRQLWRSSSLARVL